MHEHLVWTRWRVYCCSQHFLILYSFCLQVGWSRRTCSCCMCDFLSSGGRLHFLVGFLGGVGRSNKLLHFWYHIFRWAGEYMSFSGCTILKIHLVPLIRCKKNCIFLVGTHCNLTSLVSEQESPPAWSQEAYHPWCILSVACAWLGREEGKGPGTRGRGSSSLLPSVNRHTPVKNNLLLYYMCGQ